MWNHQRERERVFAVQTARKQTGRGQCAKGLLSLDHAQARLDLGLYAREATTARVRCYEKLGFHELASAHRRMLADFYTNEPMALPEADGSSVFRITDSGASNFDTPPGWLRISRPRYSAYASRSKIVGRVVVSFELSRQGRPRAIRVLEMPHPLLATWAIEAVSQAEKKRLKQDPVIRQDAVYLASFVFEWRWAEKDPD
jgi:hypothetical protein